MIFLIFAVWSERIENYTLRQILFIIFCVNFHELWPSDYYYICISRSQSSSCVSFIRSDFGLCMYYLEVWSNFNLLRNSLWTIFSTHSCIIIYSLYYCYFLTPLKSFYTTVSGWFFTRALVIASLLKFSTFFSQF